VHAFRAGLDLAGREQLVYEGLGGVAGGGAQDLFVCVGGDGVWVVGEQVAEVECEGSGLFDGNRPGVC
jgi:hypothetical protein